MDRQTDYYRATTSSDAGALNIYKSLIYWYILKIFTGLVGITLD
jgi:hypothetical protein